MARGGLWWADLGEPRGSGPALRRPVLVVQSDRYNASRLSTVVVCALTTNRRLAALPGNVSVPSGIGGLAEDSVVNVTQMAALDRTSFEERIGTLPDHLLDQVARGVRRVLAL